jgi:hypothetical protein
LATGTKVIFVTLCQADFYGLYVRNYGVAHA